MARYLSCLLIIILLLSTISIAGNNESVQDGTTADILRIYGIKDVPSVLEEEAELNLLSDTYNVLAAKVARNDMLALASEDLSKRYKALIMSYDKDIYSLESNLELAGMLIESSGNEDVSTIVKNDLNYRTIQSELLLKLKERQTLSEQLTTVRIDYSTSESDKEELSKVKESVDIQKDKLQEALSYSKVGNVGSNLYPIKGKFAITSIFGWRLDPLSQVAMEYHSGLDFGAKEGTPVLAQFNGVVERSEFSTTSGNTITINHGEGIRTVYLHLKTSLVSKGDIVKQYQQIALSGNTGTASTGPHLHFSIYINGEALDPQKLYN